jgi:nucleotide-binding universal stress UspA family protein
MIERIVVPLDGSMTAEAILSQLRRVLYRSDSEIILVRAVEPPMADNPIMLAEEVLAAAREYMLAKVNRLQQEGVRVRCIVRFGTPAGVILDVVESEKATMVALATHGATGLKRLLFGSVAETVIRKSPVPVFLVRPFWSYDLIPAGASELRPVKNLLLPIDGSDLALQALPGIVEFARLFESRIILLRIFEGADRRAVVAPETTRAREELEELAGAIERQGLKTVRLLGTGEPVDRILETVREQKIDMIAMATHGRSGVSRLKEGSITEQVLRRAEVPVLVTRVSTPAKAVEGLKVSGGRKN